MEVLFAATESSGISIAIVLGLLTVAIGLFAWGYFSVDIVTLLLLLGLVSAGILTPKEAFSGLFVHRLVRTTKDMVRDPASILRN